MLKQELENKRICKRHIKAKRVGKCLVRNFFRVKNYLENDDERLAQILTNFGWRMLTIKTK